MTAPAFIPCTARELPTDRQVEAMGTAVRENPTNHPDQSGATRAVLEVNPDAVLTPFHLALMTTKYWGSAGRVITVSFMDNAPQDLQKKIVEFANHWNKYCNIRFELVASGGLCRITRTPGEGLYSFVGTDNLHIPANQNTMNLEGFTMQTPESEFYRVVEHEFGHLEGFMHEHMRPEVIDDLDVQKTIAYFQQFQGWSPQQTRQQVLSPPPPTSWRGSQPGADKVSVMCYQLPASITKSGKPIPGGTRIDEIDAAFAASVYPLPQQPTPPVPPTPPPPPADDTVVIPKDMKAGTWHKVA